MEIESTNLLKIIVAVLTIFITLVLYILIKKFKDARKGILLIGLRDTGKTLIFSQLVHGKYVDTCMSIKENVGDFDTTRGILRIVDIPGHDQLRYKFFDQYKASARGIVYVIESRFCSSSFRNVAECLYNILADPVIFNNKVPVLILCNKQDLDEYCSPDFFRIKLEEEFVFLRVTKLHDLETVDGKSNAKIFLGKQSQPFHFDDLPMKVSFAAVSARKEKDGDDSHDLSEFKKWLVKVA